MHHPQKLLEVNIPAFVLIINGHCVVDIVSLGVVAIVLGHGFKKVSRGKKSILIGIKGVKDLLPDEYFALVDKVSNILSRVKLIGRDIDPGGHGFGRV